MVVYFPCYSIEALPFKVNYCHWKEKKSLSLENVREKNVSSQLKRPQEGGDRPN
jgi:hypothetical protein